jgi:CRP/FNR family transcriptional regulator, cyclic AMP receptor protein
MLHSPELSHRFQAINSHWDTGRENDASHNTIAALPIVTYQAGETVIAYGSRTDQLLILKKGAVAIVKEDIEIARVSEPGAVFGELSALLDQPNKVDVRAVQTSQFYVADAAILLVQDPIAAHVTITLARQVDDAADLQMNRSLRWIS